MTRRPSSTVVRRRCYEYWKTPDGTLICYKCGAIIDPIRNRNAWEAEHDKSRYMGGDDFPPNVKPICSPEAGGCHTEKTRDDAKVHAKARRVEAKRLGFKRSKSPVPGSKRSKWKKKYNRQTGRWETVLRTK